jgi:putative transposase
MDEDALRALLREAVGETVAEVLQTLLHLDREAFLREHGGTKNGHYPPQPGDAVWPGEPPGP